MDGKPDCAKIDAAKCIDKEFPGGDAAPEGGELRVSLGRRAYDEIRKHAAEVSDREICGVLLGDLCKDAKGPFLHITEIIRGEHTASQGAQVTITHETWNHFHKVKDSKFADKQYLGWYHSHPDFGIFLSSMDLFIHENFFSAPHQVALVVDPIRREEGVFVWRAGKPERAKRFWVGKEAHEFEPEPEPSREELSLREIEKKIERLRGQVGDMDAALREKPEAGGVQTVLLMGIVLVLLLQMFMGYLKDRDLNMRLAELSRRSALEQLRSAMLDVNEDRKDGCIYLEYRMPPDPFLNESHTEAATGLNVRKYKLDEANSRRYLDYLMAVEASRHQDPGQDKGKETTPAESAPPKGEDRHVTGGGATP